MDKRADPFADDLGDFGYLNPCILTGSQTSDQITEILDQFGFKHQMTTNVANIGVLDHLPFGPDELKEWTGFKANEVAYFFFEDEETMMKMMLAIPECSR